MMASIHVVIVSIQLVASMVIVSTQLVASIVIVSMHFILQLFIVELMAISGRKYTRVIQKVLSFSMKEAV